jgi:hypothetical protein
MIITKTRATNTTFQLRLGSCMTRSSREQGPVRCSVSITLFSTDASIGIMTVDLRSGEGSCTLPCCTEKRVAGPREYTSPGQKLYERARARQETDCGFGRGVGRAGAHAGASTMSDSLFSRREYRSPFCDRKGTARLSPVRLTTSYERQNLQNDLQPLSARLVVFPTVLKSLS